MTLWACFLSKTLSIFSMLFFFFLVFFIVCPRTQLGAQLIFLLYVYSENNSPNKSNSDVQCVLRSQSEVQFSLHVQSCFRSLGINDHYYYVVSSLMAKLNIMPLNTQQKHVEGIGNRNLDSINLRMCVY